jgi:hypothetical protein
MKLINMDKESRNTRIPTKSWKAGLCLGKPIWRCVFKFLPCELARDSESTSRTRSARGPASHSTSYTRPVIPKGDSFWTFGEGHRRPACVRQWIPWFGWVGFLPLSQSQRGRDRCAPFFCCEKSKSYRLLVLLRQRRLLSTLVHWTLDSFF